MKDMNDLDPTIGITDDNIEDNINDNSSDETGEIVETWERLPGESGAAFAAFRAYRDFGPDRTIRKAIERAYKHKLDKPARDKRYRVWRNWCYDHNWAKRAGDYDYHTDTLVKAELRKSIQRRVQLHRKATGRLLQMAVKKLAAMDPDDIPPYAIGEWIRIAIKEDLEIDQVVSSLYPESQDQGYEQMIKGMFPPELKGI